MNKERPAIELQQYNHLQALDENLENLRSLERVSPNSSALDIIKKQVFSSYYGSTRVVTRDEDNNLVIEKDEEIIRILRGKV